MDVRACVRVYVYVHVCVKGCAHAVLGGSICIYVFWVYVPGYIPTRVLLGAWVSVC